MYYRKIVPPSFGHKIVLNKDHSLNVPEQHLQKIAQIHNIQFLKDIFWYIMSISDIKESRYQDFIKKRFIAEVSSEMGLLAEQLEQKGI